MFVDGNWVGISRDPLDLTTHLVSMRRKDIIDAEVSVVRDIKNSELRIATDAGRCLRPLFVVDRDEDDGVRKLTIKKRHLEMLESLVRHLLT